MGKNLTEQRDEFKAKVDELTASLESKDSEISNLTAERDEVKTKLEASEKSVTDLTAERDDLTGKLEASETKVTELEGSKADLETKNTELESKEADVEKRASARFAQMQAELGGSPLETKPEGPEGKNPTEGLTGLEKAIAAHKAAAK
jgi:chromosome segregation ATPase